VPPPSAVDARCFCLWVAVALHSDLRNSVIDAAEVVGRESDGDCADVFVEPA
jgi:hypothetical protein